ncbi:4-hydroxythreonine-4-phosphate dehydrogenase PdxA [uncultured Prevotella sp.]|uniref:PdxA family dehydrogenase n=1 Tax=uncultured Prevotella sp. TaxID=159272 RepID=UPI00266C19A2|nr:4-hydroxythreonine-4-phosphate dehydrogenase PdxA [uncultured Prevotella sp.]
MEDRKIRVAITHGDTNGIGYELIFKTFAEPEMLELCTPIIYGSPKIAAYHRKAMNIQANFSIINRAEDAQDGRVNLLTCFDDDVKVEIGTPTKESGEAALKALDRAMTDFRSQLYDVLVACPVDNTNMSADNYSYKNLKEYSETSIGDGAKGIKIMINETLRIALATDGLAIKDIPANLTEERLVAKIKALHASMQRDFRISNPRIAVLALNPKADGTEENTIIIPAVKRSEEEGINAYGPYAADEFFGHSLYEAFDCVLAMYDDQANIPFTTLMQNDGICYIASLPLVCTTPALSPDFVNAGTGEYDESALRHAIFTAIDIVRNRDEHDLPLANPLQKLYHEKRDDSEKVRFSIPKKREPFNRNEHNDRRPSQRPAQADNKNGGAPQKPDANKQQTAE